MKKTLDNFDQEKKTCQKCLGGKHAKNAAAAARVKSETGAEIKEEEKLAPPPPKRERLLELKREEHTFKSFEEAMHFIRQREDEEKVSYLCRTKNSLQEGKYFQCHCHQEPEKASKIALGKREARAEVKLEKKSHPAPVRQYFHAIALIKNN